MLDYIRGIVRPLVTLMLVTTLCVTFIKIITKVTIPDLSADVFIMIIAGFISSVSTALAFWFASRQNKSN